MSILSGVNGFGHVRTAAASLNTQPALSQSRAAEEDGAFDQISVSSSGDASSRMQRELVSRISNDVRTAVSTGDIQALRQQFLNGEYRPTAEDTAASILMMGGVG